MKLASSSIVLSLAMLMFSSASLADKPVIGVAEFRNQTSAGWWGGGVGWELSSMLANELAALGSFRIVERSKLEHVLAEQNLAASGRIAAGSGAKIGKLTGAQYLIMGTVSAFESNTKSSGGGLSFKGISFGGKKSEAYIAVDLRVVDTTTGEVAFVRTVEARSKSSGMRIGVHRGGFGGSLAKEKKTPVGKAIRAVLIEITDYLDCVMVQKDSCVSDYNAKEHRRRDRTKSSISLD